MTTSGVFPQPPSAADEVGAGACPWLSESACHAGPQSGSAALPCGKPAAFRPMPTPLPSSAHPGRLSLPGCAEEVVQCAGTSERRSLSANLAAEPQVIVDPSEANLDKPRLGVLFGGPLARGKGKPCPCTVRVRSGGLQERMAMRRYVVHSRYRGIRAYWQPCASFNIRYILKGSACARRLARTG
jgi:hypothetical protein